MPSAESTFCIGSAGGTMLWPVRSWPAWTVGRQSDAHVPLGKALATPTPSTGTPTAGVAALGTHCAPRRSWGGPEGATPCPTLARAPGRQSGAGAPLRRMFATPAAPTNTLGVGRATLGKIGVGCASRRNASQSIATLKFDGAHVPANCRVSDRLTPCALRTLAPSPVLRIGCDPPIHTPPIPANESLRDSAP